MQQIHGESLRIREGSGGGVSGTSTGGGQGLGPHQPTEEEQMMLEMLDDPVLLANTNFNASFIQVPKPSLSQPPAQRPRKGSLSKPPPQKKKIAFHDEVDEIPRPDGDFVESDHMQIDDQEDDEMVDDMMNSLALTLQSDLPSSTSAAAGPASTVSYNNNSSGPIVKTSSNPSARPTFKSRVSSLYINGGIGGNEGQGSTTSLADIVAAATAAANKPALQQFRESQGFVGSQERVLYVAPSMPPKSSNRASNNGPGLYRSKSFDEGPPPSRVQEPAPPLPTLFSNTQKPNMSQMRSTIQQSTTRTFTSTKNSSVQCSLDQKLVQNQITQTPAQPDILQILKQEHAQQVTSLQSQITNLESLLHAQQEENKAQLQAHAAQKKSFEKLSGQAWSKIRELMLEKEIRDIEMQSLRNQV